MVLAWAGGPAADAWRGRVKFPTGAGKQRPASRASLAQETRKSRAAPGALPQNSFERVHRAAMTRTSSSATLDSAGSQGDNLLRRRQRRKNMGKNTWVKVGLIAAAVGVVGVAICVALVVAFAGAEPLPPPGEAPLAAEGKPAGEAPPEEAVTAEQPRAKAAAVAAPAAVRRMKPVPGALIELRFKNLAGFLRAMSEVINEVSPGRGETPLDMAGAFLGAPIEDWLGEGPVLIAARKVTGTDYPVAFSVPVRNAEAFLNMVERLVGPKEGTEGGLTTFIRFGAAGGADLEVHARIAEGRAVVSPDRELLKELTGESAAPEEDVWARIDSGGLLEAYWQDLERDLAHAPPGVPAAQWEQVHMWLDMFRAIARDMDAFTVALSIGDEALIHTARTKGKPGGFVEKAWEAVVPVGRPDELKWLPSDGTVSYAAGINGEKLGAVLEEMLRLTDNETMRAMLQKMEGWQAGPGAVSFGAGGKMCFLSAMRAPDAEKARAQTEKYMSGKMSWPGAGEMALSYERAARKVGDVEIDRARVEMKTEDQQAQMMMAMMPGMIEYQFAYPPGVMLMAWGVDADELMDAAIERPAPGGPSLADSEFYHTLPPNVCAAGEFYGLRYAQMIIGMMGAFGGPAVDFGDWTPKDIPWKLLAWKEEGTLCKRLVVPRAALKVYGEAARAIAAATEGPPPVDEDIGF